MSEKIVHLNEEVIKGQLKELVRGSVEETLNGLLEAEAEKLTQAGRYERSEQRQGYRRGHYNRNLMTTAGEVKLHVPRLKGVTFETAIIERYRRRESSVEEALMEMYLAGVSVRRVEDITEALWGCKVSSSTISELNKKAYEHIEQWRNRPLEGGKYPYVYVDGVYLKRNWGGEYENGYRQVLCANSFTSLAELSLHRAGKPALNYLVAEDRERVKGGEAACEALDVSSVFCYQPASSSCISMCFMLMYFFPPHWVPAT